MINNWGTVDGGFILSDDSNDAATGTNQEKKLAMFNAFKKYYRRLR